MFRKRSTSTETSRSGRSSDPHGHHDRGELRRALPGWTEHARREVVGEVHHDVLDGGWLERGQSAQDVHDVPGVEADLEGLAFVLDGDLLLRLAEVRVVGLD